MRVGEKYKLKPETIALWGGANNILTILQFIKRGFLNTDQSTVVIHRTLDSGFHTGISAYSELKELINQYWQKIE